MSSTKICKIVKYTTKDIGYLPFYSLKSYIAQIMSKLYAIILRWKKNNTSNVSDLINWQRY